MSTRRLSASAVTLERSSGGYEVRVHEVGWEGAIGLEAGALDALMWKQLKRPMCLAQWPDGRGLWRYQDEWYAAPGDATPAAILEAVEAQQRAVSTRHVAPPDAARDEPEEPEGEQEEEEEWCERVETFDFPFVGRLVWKDFLAHLVEYASRERLEITYESRTHLFSVALMVTLRGDSRALTRFASFSQGLLLRYQPPGGK